MRQELANWSFPAGTELESWVECMGNFSLAVGYATLFWPKFSAIGEYIFRGEPPAENIAGFENQAASTPKSVEAVLNHLHLADIQHAFCEDSSKDKLIHLGLILKEIYEAKLAREFPGRPCTVELYYPDDPEYLWGYQITFWQSKHS